MTIITDRLAVLHGITLDKGAHTDFAEGAVETLRTSALDLLDRMIDPAAA